MAKKLTPEQKANRERAAVALSLHTKEEVRAFLATHPEYADEPEPEITPIIDRFGLMREKIQAAVNDACETGDWYQVLEVMASNEADQGSVQKLLEYWATFTEYYEPPEE